MMWHKGVAAALLASAALVMPSAANAAGAAITNGPITLGVNDYGELNYEADIGLRGVYDNRTGFDGTRAGCLCEGWGVANAGDGTAGWADRDQGGANNLTLDSFTSTASTATSTVHVTSGGSGISVKQEYAPSASPDLYQNTVTITNTGAGTISNLLYRRLMDWDIEPTEFSEYVTIQGWPASALLHTSDDGFSSANPLADYSGITAPDNTNFTDDGTADHGALFDFQFGSLAAGETVTFMIYYGAALNEAAAFAALGAVGAEVYSFGQSSDNINGSTPDRSTFIFAFSGVGGTPVPPSGVPEPSTWAMMLLGFGAVGFGLRADRKKKATADQFA
jgi:type IV pilus assembly protein PilY1